MQIASKHFNKVFLIIIMISAMACNRPKRLYISNKTDKAITLKVNAGFMVENESIQTAFKDSLHGKRIEPGHITINFGEGKWSKSDEESLKGMLQNITVTKDGSIKGFKLPDNITIGHGLLIQELIIKIHEP